jgi:SAM-dependent methyltransferase
VQSSEKEEISPYEFSEYSWCDSNGRLLRLPKDDGYIYRAITEESYKIFVDLKKQNKLSLLVDTGLVETIESPMRVDGYAAVLKHRRVPFISLPNEWTMQMLKDAGVMMCRLAIELDRLGYGLQDGHPWNVSFMGTKPVFLDWGSIVKQQRVSRGRWLSEFRKHIYIPLWLFSKGFRTLAYESLWERRGGAVKTFFNHRYLKRFPLPFYIISRKHMTPDFQKVLHGILRLVQKINVKALPEFWSDYDQSSYAYKDKAFNEFLDRLPEKSSILDIGCNKGTYSIECSKAGHQVVAFDYDARAIDELYTVAQKNNYDLVALHVNIIRPTPGFGPDLNSPSIFDRLRCEYVLAFAISHHLAKNYALTFEMLARILNKYAQKGVLVEYIDPNDLHLQGWQRKGWRPPVWYNEQIFMDSFRQYFSLKKVWQTGLDEKIVRKLFYFERE